MICLMASAVTYTSLVIVSLAAVLLLGACDRDSGCGQVADDFMDSCCTADGGAECPSRKAVKGDCNDVLKYCNDPSAKCELAVDGNGDPVCDRTTTYIKCWPCQGPVAPAEE